ncbi:MAG: flagellar motor switch phosphatase FliY [Lachnospiraceae bacterium]|nr:flagellar motor switch phosphatase FliY [Lachnospiraceae bacterium]MBP5299554.1 flagellar motor switch phosphatase FliY [Lachnospiraceae bacterium]
MEELTRDDLDILGEIANISLGNAATTLSMMVNHKVNITTPNVKIINRSEAMDDFEKTCIFVQIHYVLGLAGNNVFILKERDVLCLTNLMMGGDGTNVEGTIGEMELSAVSEAMNQMMGTSATSMATMLERNVDISTPQVNAIDVESVKLFEKMFETYNEKFVKIAFKLEIEGLIKSTMVQLYPVSFAKDMVAVFRSNEHE